MAQITALTTELLAKDPSIAELIKNDLKLFIDANKLVDKLK